MDIASCTEDQEVQLKWLDMSQTVGLALFQTGTWWEISRKAAELST